LVGAKARFVVFVLVVGLMSACSGAASDPPATDAPSTEPPATVAVAVAERTTVPETTTTAAETTTTTEGPKTFESGAFAVPFTILQPEGTILKRGVVEPGFLELLHRSGQNVAIFFTSGGPTTLETWSAKVADYITVSDEVGETSVGGLPTVYADYVSDKRGAIPGVNNWQNETGDVGRVYIVDVDGVPVSVVAVVGPELWEGFIPELEAVLAGLTWG